MAKSSTSFKKGESGNPSGRPKILAEVIELARMHTKDAVNTLHKITKSTKAPPAACVSAATALLDRGWGKPTQNMVLDDRRSLTELTDAELTAIVRGEAGSGDGTVEAQESPKRSDRLH